MQIGVVNYPKCVEISTIAIGNIDTLCARFYDSSCDVTRCVVIVGINWEGLCVLAVYILVQLEYQFYCKEAVETGNVFGLKS